MNDAARQPVDQQQRDRALDPGGSFIVQAPAGSGKTGLLTLRLLRLLAIVERPEEILAITFTRKAAGEMHVRVVQALQAAADGNRPDDPHEAAFFDLAQKALERDRDKGWALLQQTQRLRVMTIDAFNASLTRQMPLLSRLGGQPQVTDDITERYDEAVRRTLQGTDLPDQQWQSVRRFLLHLGNHFGSAREMLRGMLARRQQWLDLLALDEDQQDNIAAALDREMAWVAAPVRAKLAVYADELCEQADRAGRRCREQGLDISIDNLEGITALPGDSAAEQPQWRGIRDLLLTADERNPKWRSSINKNQGFPPGSDDDKNALKALLNEFRQDDQLLDALNRLGRFPGPLGETQWQQVLDFLAVCKIAVANLQVVFAEQNEVDHPEVAERALRALGEPERPTDLALHLDYRIHHLLVDEFQDTSRAQMELLRRLTAGWTPGDGRSLFLVGDPMQSIYRFREAEVGLFLDVWDRGLGDLELEPLRLQTNFRSGQGIVDWVNRAFGSIFPEQHDIAAGAVEYARSEAWHGAEPETAVTVHPWVGRDDPGEAQRVVETVRAIRQTDPEATVGILARARTHLTFILPALRESGLAFTAVELEHLARRPEIQDLLALTRALLHPGDTVAEAAVYRAPWCGATLDQLEQLPPVGACLQANQYPGHRKSSLPRRSLLAGEQEDVAGASPVDQWADRITQTTKILRNARQHAQRTPVRDLLERTWLALNGPACYEQPEAVDNAAVFFELLADHDRGGDLDDPVALEEALGDMYGAADSSPEAANIQVMTMHKAKGLEFDHVILPGLGRGAGCGDKSPLQWSQRPRSDGRIDLLVGPVAEAGGKDPLYQWIDLLEKDKQDHERRRLLYVAATRARKRLHLMGSIQAPTDNDAAGTVKTPSKDSLLHLLWPLVEDQFAATEPSHHDEDNAAPWQPTYTRIAKEWQALEPPADVDWTPPATGHAEEQRPEFFWAGPGARQVGQVVHRLLQQIAADGTDQWPDERVEQTSPIIDAMLRAEGVPEAMTEACRQRVQQALRTTLADKHGRWILADHAGAESELALNHWRDGALETAIIDRTFVDDNGARWIVDYKTSSHEGGDIEAFLEREAERYANQMSRYREAMLAMEPAREVRIGLYFPLLGRLVEA